MDKELEEFLTVLSRELNTQDNLATANPLYCVEQEHKIYGIDSDYGDQFIWSYKEDPEYSWDDLEKALKDCPESREEDFEKIYYVTEWRFVNAHLTMKAAKQYIANFHYNHPKCRVFVTSQYRCFEWIKLIDLIKKLTRETTQKGEKQ